MDFKKKAKILSFIFLIFLSIIFISDNSLAFKKVINFNSTYQSLMNASGSSTNGYCSVDPLTLTEDTNCPAEFTMADYTSNTNLDSSDNIRFNLFNSASSVEYGYMRFRANLTATNISRNDIISLNWTWEGYKDSNIVNLTTAFYNWDSSSWDICGSTTSNTLDLMLNCTGNNTYIKSTTNFTNFLVRAVYDPTVSAEFQHDYVQLEINYNGLQINNINNQTKDFEVYNTKTATLNVSATGYNHTFLYSLDSGITNITFCQGAPNGNCLESQTNVIFNKMGFYNLTVYANNSANSWTTATAKNIFVGNLTEIFYNTFLGVNDTYIYANDANTNFGTATIIYYSTDGTGSAGNTEAWAMFKFLDLGRTIINGRVIRANLSLGASGTNYPGWVERVTSDWNETAVTWNTRPTSEGTKWSSFSSISTTGYTNITITSLVNNWVNGTYTNFGFKLNTSQTDEAENIISKENTNRRPYLTLVWYIINSLPTISLNSPLNSSTLSINKTVLNLTITELDGDPTIVKFYVNTSVSNLDTNLEKSLWNTSKVYGTNTTTFNLSNGNDGLADGTYYWRAKADDLISGNTTSQTYVFRISTTNPAVTLNFPTQSYATTQRNITFNATCTDSNGISNFSLFHNIEGTYKFNQTNTSIATSGTTWNWTTIYNIPDGTYRYNALCTNSLGTKDFAFDNFTFTVDNIVPNLTVASPNQSFSVVSNAPYTLSINITAQDTSLDKCWYMLKQPLATSFDINKTFTCASNTTQEIISYGNGELQVFTNDTAGNTNSSEILSFTLTQPAGEAPSGGATGGGGAPLSLVGAGNCTELEFSTKNIDLYRTEKVKPLIIRNNFNKSVTLQSGLDTKLINVLGTTVVEAGQEATLSIILKKEENPTALITDLEISTEECLPRLIKVYIHKDDELPREVGFNILEWLKEPIIFDKLPWLRNFFLLIPGLFLGLFISFALADIKSVVGKLSLLAIITLLTTLLIAGFVQLIV